MARTLYTWGLLPSGELALASQAPRQPSAIGMAVATGSHTHHLCSSPWIWGLELWPKLVRAKCRKLLCETTAKWRSGRAISHCKAAQLKAVCYQQPQRALGCV